MSDELEGRDFQLLADLERAFPRTSFLKKKEFWVSFDGRSTLSSMKGDVESIRRLIEKGKIVHLGELNSAEHFVVKKKE